MSDMRQAAAYSRDFKEISKPKKVPGENSAVTQRDIDVILQQINTELRKLITKVYGRIGQDDFSRTTQDYINNKVSQEYVESEVFTVLQQNEEIIRQQAGKVRELDDAVQTQQTALEQTYNALTLSFETIQKYAEDEIEAFKKYIRFEDGSIILGEDGNELTLKISADNIAYRTLSKEFASFDRDSLKISNNGSLQRIEIGVDGSDPYLAVYDSTETLQLKITKDGIAYGSSTRQEVYSIGTKSGIGFFV